MTKAHMKISAIAAIAALGLGALSLGACNNKAEEAPQATAHNELTGDGGVPDFYTADQPAKGPPGKLLKSEPQTGDLVLENAGTALRILYTSTDGLDGTTPINVSGALYLPKGDAPEGGWPLMAWAHGTVGVADVCAPSFAGRSQRDITYLNYWLGKGYAVVASDYQGLGTPGGHPYLAARPEAYSVLDSIRAVQGADFPVSKKVVLFGQSQGGGAAFATASYAPDYAPELDIRGTVATGTPYISPEAQAALDASRDKDAVDETFGYDIFGLSTVELVNPQFRLEDYFTEAALPVVLSINHACYGELAKEIEDDGLTRNKAYTQDITPVQSQVFALMAYPHLKIPTPIFMGTGGKDHDVPPPMQLALGADACAAGTVIEQHVYPDLDHSGTVNGSTGESSVFVEKAFAGEPIKGNCDNRPSAG